MTTTYSTDEKIIAAYADAEQLLQTDDLGSFDRLRVIVKKRIDVALDSRTPRQAGVIGSDRFEWLETCGVLGMLFSENSTSDGKDLYANLSKRWTDEYGYLIENIRARIIDTGEEDIDDIETFGNEIPVNRS